MCSSCGGGLWGHHHWGHMLIKLIIVLFIFWAGVQFGELKFMIQNSYYGGMGGFGGNTFYTTSARGMMEGALSTPASSGVTVQMMRVATSTK